MGYVTVTSQSKIQVLEEKEEVKDVIGPLLDIFCIIALCSRNGKCTYLAS